MRIRIPHYVPLKKELGLLGSFSIGFADVGANIFLALGLIAAYAHGALPLAILIAAFVYVCTGLAYAELASSIPVSGGSSVYGKRAFGGFVGFLGGWGLILDYIICTSLFAVASIGYLTFFFPQISEYSSFATALLVGALIIINLIGIKESSLLNSSLTLLTIAVVLALIGVGFGYSFNLEKLLSEIKPINIEPGWNDFLYSITLAMVTFIGIESISQAAEETRDPGRIIPRASALAIFLVVFFALSTSIMALGIISPAELEERMNNPLVAIALNLPFTDILVPIIAFAGFMICCVSANTGIIGVSRVVYSMSKSNLISSKFRWIHPTFRTPWITILSFSILALILAYYADMLLLGELYAFGALTAYLISNLSLIALRIKEPNLKRPFKLPLNIRFRSYEIPLISISGAIGCFAIFLLVILLHEQGRILAGAWFGIGAIIYLSYQQYISILPEIESYMSKPSGATILVPVKLVIGEEEIMDTVSVLSKQMEASVTLLHIIELPPTVPLWEELPPSLISKKMEEITELKKLLELRGVPVHIAIKNARNVVDGILDFTYEKNVKLIFLNERKPSPIISEIKRRTDIPVLIHT